MIIVTPLTLKGTRSMMMMQQLQPEMKKIQTQYKDDRQKLNEELLKFYKENNINPLGGCLPLLVQMPVFIVLYQVLRGPDRCASDLGFDPGWVVGPARHRRRRRPSRRTSNARSIRPTSTTRRSCTRPVAHDADEVVRDRPVGSASKALSQGVVPRAPLPRC